MTQPVFLSAPKFTEGKWLTQCHKELNYQNILTLNHALSFTLYKKNRDVLGRRDLMWGMKQHISMRWQFSGSSITIIIINDNKPHCIWKYRHYWWWCRCLGEKMRHRLAGDSMRGDSALTSPPSLFVRHMGSICLSEHGTKSHSRAFGGGRMQRAFSLVTPFYRWGNWGAGKLSSALRCRSQLMEKLGLQASSHSSLPSTRTMAAPEQSS